MTKARYSVLIRTFNSKSTLPLTLECLANQSASPDQYVFVDSGSTDTTASLFPDGSVVHRYVGREFNYSDALNQGLDHVSNDYVFIVSSHTLLIKHDAIEYALSLLQANPNIGATYFDDASGVASLRYDLIDKDNFDGRNGLWNWCALIRMDLLKRRRFRPEVFSAEDQEWASWLFLEEGKSVARIFGAGAINHNPMRLSLRKNSNEEVAIAYYSRRELLRSSNIVKVAVSAISPRGGLRPRYRASRLVLACRLFACRFSEPKANSRYF